MADYAAEAQKAIELIYGPQKQALSANQQMALSRANADIAALQGWGQTGGAAIDAAYTGFLNDLARNREASTQNFNTTLQTMGQNYNTAAQAGNDARAAARAQLESMAQRLGGSFSDAAANSLAPGEAEWTKIMAINQGANQGLMNNLTSYGQAYDASRGVAETNAKGAQAFAHSKFQSELGNLIAEAQQARREKDLEYQSRLMELLSQGGQFGLSYAGQLIDRDQRIELQNAQLAAQAALAQAQIDAENARHSASIQAENARAAAAAAARGQDDSWEREKFYASLGLDKEQAAAEQARWEAEFGLKAGAAPNYSGISGAYEYAAANGLSGSNVQQMLSLYDRYANDPATKDALSASIMSYNAPGGSISGWKHYVPEWLGGKPPVTGMTREQARNILGIYAGEWDK